MSQRVLAAGIRVLDRGMGLGLSAVVVAALAVEIGIVVANVVARQLFSHPLTWQLPTSQVLLVPLAFFGAALNYHEGRSIHIDLVTRRVSPRYRVRLAGTSRWTTAALSLLLAFWAVDSIPQANEATYPGLSLHEGWMPMCIAAAMASIALTSLLRLAQNYTRDSWYGLAPALLTGLGVFVLLRVHEFTDRLGVSLAVSTLIAFVALLLGIPIVFILLLVPSLTILFSGTPSSTIITQLDFSLTSFILVAIPFFVFAGFILTEGGIGAAIIRTLNPILSRLPGGLLQLMLGTAFVFSGLSGSKLADATAVGASLRESLESEGYAGGEAAAVLSAAAAAGETIPPSIALLILGSVTSLSIESLFMAGVLPAVIISLAVGVTIMWRAKHGSTGHAVLREPSPASTDLEHESATSGGTWREIVGGLPALGLPAVLFGGIESGFATIAEVAAIAVVYAMIVATFSRNRVGVRGFARIAERSASMTGLVLLLVAAGSAMAATTALAQVPQDIAAAVTHLGASKYVFLLLTILIMPIAGALLEGPPAILVFAPLLVPTAMSLGVNGVHFGIVFILAFGIGTFSPLLGIGFYTACEVLGADVASATRRCVPYFFWMFVALGIVAFVPDITLVLPRWLGMPGV